MKKAPKLADQMREFFASGGAVEEIPMGISKLKDSMGVREQFDRVYKTKKEKDNNGHTDG
jgi:hypothetical protein